MLSARDIPSTELLADKLSDQLTFRLTAAVYFL